MKDGFIKTASCTPEIRVADPAYNISVIEAQICDAVKNGCKIAAFPELCVTGATCGDLMLHSVMLSAAESAVKTLLEHTANLDILVAVGVPVMWRGNIYDCIAFCLKGQLLALPAKTEISNNEDVWEKRYFSPAPEKAVYVDFAGFNVPMGADIILQCREMPSLRIAAEVGRDLWGICQPSQRHALMGANLILNCAAVNEIAGRAEYRRELVRSQSARLSCAYVYTDAGDGESTTDLVFGGHHIIAENGNVISENKPFENGTTYADIDVDAINFERTKKHFSSSAECCEVGFSLEICETLITRVYTKSPFIYDDEEKRSQRCAEILEMQCSGLKKRMLHTHSEKTVVGVSGGLDSCLALLVAARTTKLLNYPSENVIAVTMPCFGTTSRTKSNAQKLSELLGCDFWTVDIGEAVKLHFNDIGHDMNVHNVVFENSQARERTQVLMDIANRVNGLVIGTGDLSELALGWATYNGDHMSMYGVNASIPKTLIQHIVRYIADTCKNGEMKAVLYDILDTPISPELLPAKDGEIAQKTEDIVGPYQLHDFYLYYILRWGFTPGKMYRIAKQTFKDEYSDDVLKKWLENFYRRFFSQQFKRSCIPDGPKIGSVSVSPRGDLHMPSDAVNSAWMDEFKKI